MTLAPAGRSRGADPLGCPRTEVAMDREPTIVVYLAAAPVPTVDDLNRLGADRWELCAGFTHEAFLHLYFKRPK